MKTGSPASRCRQKKKEQNPPHRFRSLKCPPPPQCRSCWGLALPQYRAVEDSWSIVHPRWLIPPPSGGSSRYFTSPSRGRAKWPTRHDSESQEDRGGPQPTSSERRPWSLTLRPLRDRGRIRLLGPGWCQARTVPLGPCPSRQRGDAGREQQGHHVEPDVTGGDTARWVAVRDAEPRELVGPAPRSDGSAVELQRGDDEKDTGVRGACGRAPQEDEQQRDAECAGRIRVGEKGQPCDSPCRGDRGRHVDERAR